MDRRMVVVMLLIVFTLGGCFRVRKPASVSTLMTDNGWVTEQWIDNDISFRTSMATIDNQIKDTRDVISVANRTKQKALNHPENTIAQFAWAYTALKYVVPMGNRTYEERYVQGMVRALAHPMSPRSYEYARLRYLVSLTWPQPNRINWIAIGNRLIMKSPDDLPVKHKLVMCLSAGTIEQRHLAVRYGLDLVRADPTNAAYHARLGGAYHELWYREPKRDYLQRAHDEYQRSFVLTPENDPWRDQARSWIAKIDKHL